MLTDGPAKEKWEALQSTIYDEAKATFGTGKISNKEWFEANIETLAPVYEKKRKAMVKDKKRSTKSSRQSLKAACSEARKSARRCANDYWLKLSQEIQQAAENGNIRGVYDGIRKAKKNSTLEGSKWERHKRQDGANGQIDRALRRTLFEGNQSDRGGP